MSKKISIAIDAMGGDNSPDKTLNGIKMFIDRNLTKDDFILNIFGKEDIIKDKIILEVGPGTGNLTSSLLKKNPSKVFVVEKDNNLASILKNKFNDQIIIINEDILKIDENIISDKRLIVFGNLPYNISTEILCKWIVNLNDDKIWFSNLVLMFQKEVADRIISD